MPERIFRYELAVTDFPEVVMPAGAKVLSVAPSRIEEARIDLWALVDPHASLTPRKFRVVGTGNPIGGRLGRFVGTVSLIDGQFIGHVFEAGAS